MTDAVSKENDKLGDLSTTLQGVENKLLHRALDRSRDEVEQSYDFINQAADAGVVDIQCGDECDTPEPEDGGEAPPPEEGGEEKAPEGDGESDSS